MNNQLPITLSAEQSLSNSVKNAKQLFEQLEAWLNFSTLKANWFEQEEQVLQCVFLILSEKSYTQTKAQIQQLSSEEQAAWQIDESQHFMLKQAHKSKQVKAVLTLSSSPEVIESADSSMIESALKAQLATIVNQIAQQNQLDSIEE